MANTDYLRWNANSLKELIVNKLTIDGTYSDQLFEGSDLSVLIDVFCYMFDTLTYLENVGASEAMFTDAQYYENINRIVKMLGYNPLGFITSTVATELGVREGYEFEKSELITIPKYTTYTTELADKDGYPVQYTFVKDYSFAVQESYISPNFKPVLYNGTWKLYPKTYVATGIPYETITLSEIPKDALLSHGHIDVYVKEPNGKVTQWEGYPNLYSAAEDDAGATNNRGIGENYFEYRLNEKREYILTFGDNVLGKQLLEKSEVSILYLQSNGPDGEIGVDIINTKGELKVDVEGLSETFIKDYLFHNNPSHIAWGTDPNNQLQYITVRNKEESSSSKSMESVDSIRRRAPGAFRTGARLITEQDFEQYILSNWSNAVYDVKVLNNWKYMTEFQSWLKLYGKLQPDIKHFNFTYADSCDFNNIYIFLKSYDNNANVTDGSKTTIETVCNQLKPLTSELIPVDILNTFFTPYLEGDYDIHDFDSNKENKIVITRDKNSMVSLERIKQNAYDVFLKFFDLKNQKLGNIIDMDQLFIDLMSIDGVKKIQTSYLKHGRPANETKYFDGLSFGFWTPFIVEGKDFTKITGNYKLKDFQFPVLYHPNSFSELIEVVSDIYNISNIEF